MARSRSSGGSSTDRFGGVLRAALAESGVDLSLADPTDAPTTLAVAELDDGGCRDLPVPHGRDVGAELSLEARRGGLREPAACPPRRDARARAGARWRSALADGVAAGRRRDAGHGRPELPAARSSADRAAYLARLERVLARADVVKVSTDDLAYLAPERPPAATLRARSSIVARRSSC